MRRTRRRARYTWLPTVGSAGATTSDNVSGREFVLGVAQDGSTNVLISELTFDHPVEGDFLANPFTPLIEVMGSEYFLKRIVGKLFASFRGNQNEDGDPSVVAAALFGAGFFIARANDIQQGGDSPIGSATISERQENYNPLGEDCIREPWIWRRTWILANPANHALKEAQFAAGLAVAEHEFGNFPSSTAGYGSVLDGPHIDAKCARRVKQDERLWFAIASIALPLTVTANNQGDINGYLDFRLLGALRKARQGSSF